MKAPNLPSRLPSSASFAFLTTVGASILFSSAGSAALLFYDGFTAGGTTPGAGQYIISPASTNGLDNSSIVRAANGTGNGQMPTTTGFSTNSGTGGWSTTDGVSAAVHARAIGSGLTYTGLQTSAGAVEIFRSGSTSGGSKKAYSRRFGSNLGTGASELYFSTLVSFNQLGANPRFDVLQSATTVFGFSFDSAGKANVIGGSNEVLGISAGAFAAGTTHLLVARVHGMNIVDLWVNPTDFNDRTANSGSLVLSDVELTSGGFVVGSSLFSLRLNGETGNSLSNPSSLFDEVHGATTWGEVFTVPEPSTALLAILGFAVCARRRR